MKKILILIIFLLLITGCSISGKTKVLSNENGLATSSLNQVVSEQSKLQPIIIYKDDNYKVYSFKPGINRLDLNFDGLEDYVFVSHINGADYYDYHVLADKDVYNFFIDNERDDLNLPSYWNIVTKEISNKKIYQFERDFLIPELLGCNGGGTLRLVQTKKNETLLVLIDENPKEKDGCNTRVRFNIYKLYMSGNIAGSDYIFSFVKEVVGESRGNGIGGLGDKDIISAIQKANF